MGLWVWGQTSWPTWRWPSKARQGWMWLMEIFWSDIMISTDVSFSQVATDADASQPKPAAFFSDVKLTKNMIVRLWERDFNIFQASTPHVPGNPWPTSFQGTCVLDCSLEHSIFFGYCRRLVAHYLQFQIEWMGLWLSKWRLWKRMLLKKLIWPQHKGKYLV